MIPFIRPAAAKDFVRISYLAGSGTPLHLAGEMFNLQASVHLMHVPYKGSSFATTDLLAGRIHAVFSGVVSFIPQIKSGKLRALAVTGTTRSPLMPEVPTFAEAGMPRFDIEVWFGLYGPAGMPADIVARLNHEMAMAMDDPELVSRMNGLGLVFPAKRSTPAQFATEVRAEGWFMILVISTFRRRAMGWGNPAGPK